MIVRLLYMRHHMRGEMNARDVEQAIGMARAMLDSGDAAPIGITQDGVTVYDHAALEAEISRREDAERTP